MKKIITIIFLSIISFSAPAENFVASVWIDGKIQQQVFAITKVMFHDVTDPAAAARFYSYCTLTGYEILYQHDHSLPHFQGNFSHYHIIDIKINFDKINIEFSALYGILETGRAILPSGYLLAEN